MLIAYDADVATVSGRLGHADASTTLKIYTHQFKYRDKAAANMLGDFATDAINNVETETGIICELDKVRETG